MAIKAIEGFIKPREALRVKNAELRREAIERIGEEAFMAGIEATVIDEQGHDRLMSTPESDEPGKPFVFLYLQDASTPRCYVLRVPDDMKRVQQAKAWTFNLKENEYTPLRET